MAWPGYIVKTAFRKLVCDWLFSRSAFWGYVQLAGAGVVFAVGLCIPRGAHAHPGWALLHLPLEALLLVLLIRPVWWFVGLPLFLAMAWSIGWRRKDWSAYPCPVCGYDIHETPHRCPECGTILCWGELPDGDEAKNSRRFRL